MKLPTLPFAVFDEFGHGADDRVQDYGRACAATALEIAAARLQDFCGPLEESPALRIVRTMIQALQRDERPSIPTVGISVGTATGDASSDARLSL